MTIRKIHIIAFGGLRDYTIEPSDGVNVLSGSNESGKSSAAMFIKFILYGLSPRAKGGASERTRFVNSETGQAAGWIITEDEDGVLWRLERALIISGDNQARERVRMINSATGEVINGENPGEYLLGMSEDVFVSTCFVSQAARTRPEAGGLGMSGSKGAVENMLTTADEDIDIRRAVRRLDNGRRELSSRSGGEIPELEEKRKTLCAELEETRGKSGEVLSVSSSLDDIKRRIDELEADSERYGAIFAALETITVKRRIDVVRQTETKLEKLKKEKEAYDDSVLGGDFPDRLAEAERGLDEYDEEKDSYNRYMPGINDDGDGRNIPEVPEESFVVDSVKALDTKGKVQFRASVALFIAGLFGIGISAAVWCMGGNNYLIPMGVTLVSAFTAIVLLVCSIKTNGRLNEELVRWDAESAEEIEIAVSEKLNVIERERAGALAVERMSTELENARIKSENAAAVIWESADALGIERSENIRDTLAAVKLASEDHEKQADAIVSKIENLSGRLQVLNEQLEGTDFEAAEAEAEMVLETPVGREAAALTPDEIIQMKRERGFTESALKSANSRRSNLTERLTELGGKRRSPAELESEIASLDEKIAELSLRRDAYEMAKAALEEAGEEMKNGVLPKITAMAAEIVSRASGYDGMAVDGSLSCSLKYGDDIKPEEYLSQGTSDMAYLALRIALAHHAAAKSIPPVILDESFAHIDRERTEAMLSALPEGQYLVFTCREEEVMAAANIGARMIEI